MENREKIYLDVLFDIDRGYVNIYNYRNNSNFREFYNALAKDIQQYSNYTFDGRFEKLLFDVLKESIRYGRVYEQFFSAMREELKKLMVPCVIIIPLNFINDAKISQNTKISENITLFKTDKPQITHRFFRDPIISETPLAKYFKEKVYKLLLRDHIEKAKDRNFFNFPLLTILINNIDHRVETESGRIVDAVYAFIRMLDFNNCLEEGGWGYMFNSYLAPASTYGVYYNKEGLTKLPEGTGANGYGYSMRFKFSPFLDVSTEGFLNNLKEFEKLLSQYIDYCFLDSINYNKETLVKIAKWQNAIQMFNTAYEFASIERYDSTMILLLTVLESLFVKNEGNKKEHLVLALQEFFKNDKKLNDNFIRDNVTQAYKSRNKFVHEGVGVENEYTYSKPLNDYQGFQIGMKPFAHIGIYHYPSNIENLRNLFTITIQVLRSYKKLIGEE